jgi:nucleoside 2-deoxyribosyltransferase
MTLKLYIAGPLFTPYHRGLHARNAARLRSEGYVCLVPHERGFMRAFEADTGVDTRPPAIAIFDMDYDMVAEADAIVALLDDPDISSGLTCEIGLFWSMMQRDPRKKGVLGLLTDDRAWRREAAGVSPVNAFSLGCILDIGVVYSSIDDVITHLNAWRDGREMPTGEIHR